LELPNGIRLIPFEVFPSTMTAKKRGAESACHSSRHSSTRVALSIYVLTEPKPLSSDILALPFSFACTNMVI
jgi:hypothetical protein